MQPKKFGDFADEPPLLEGEKLKIEQLINKEILVLGYRIADSKYNGESPKKYLTIQLSMEDSKHIVFTGSKVLRDQIEKYSKEIPFFATIKKVDKYYTFT